MNYLDRINAKAQFKRAVHKNLDKYATRDDVKDVALIIENLTGVEISEWDIDLAHSNLTSPMPDELDF